MTAKNDTPPPAYRVFISSTSEDMKDYRKAASEAMTNILAVPMGMDRFTALAGQTVLERCYEEIRQSQYFVIIIGFRYGSIYKETDLSYTELEFNEAERLGIPILVFIRNGSIDSDSIDIDDLSRLVRFKNRLQKSASNRLTASFTTPEDLRDKLTRSLQTEFSTNNDKGNKKVSSSKSNVEEYVKGASLYKKFILMPGEYCDQTVRLRVRFDGNFGSWRLKEELYEAYNLPVGKALYLQGVFVLGANYNDVDDDARHIDLFAVGDAARWILENSITKGSVFESDFVLEWKYAKNIAGKSRIQVGASNAYIAKLILKSSDIKLIAQNSNTAIPKLPDSVDGSDQNDLLSFLKELI